ncbi:hypothetical protein NMK91_10545 [Corynebacterium pseudotuberculosis]|uniref:hypothetical protein n=2 Tax=Corynebacterium pseudotuberculosis TaxID=1719 RepID=UPI001E631C9F|nr:hypothetical protein [Corynebacterium pseudotuberculosis]UTO24452.1 hypothetical protein NMK91_10545 [Corynebacterium pseudotuberculosis]WAE88187.1 hypothetical protein LJU16_10585 [Corynebacterium pseudotuberculosis]WAF13687.1 hypothetical protein LJU03_10575 [Corynebacterium pseudotuberculosis]WAF17786.1 hypothetical protein LJU00_10585 [Corynebacterium pseudotuberculosis]WAF23008.1 hypothetical protein LJT97_10585 [Corynebacterium pseudotuberculosis]
MSCALFSPSSGANPSVFTTAERNCRLKYTMVFDARNHGQVCSAMFLGSGIGLTPTNDARVKVFNAATRVSDLNNVSLIDRRVYRDETRIGLEHWRLRFETNQAAKSQFVRVYIQRGMKVSHKITPPSQTFT